MGPSPSRGHVILFPKANQAELASGSQLFPSNPLGSGAGPGWGLLTCSAAGQPPPKGSHPEVPRGSQPRRQEACPSQAAEERAEWPVQIHSAGVRCYPERYIWKCFHV